MQMADSMAHSIAGLEHVGRVAVGRRADVLLFGADLRLHKTLISGRVVFNADAAPAAL